MPATALVLAAISIYGVMSYAVVLGAALGDALGMVVMSASPLLFRGSAG